MIGTWGKQGDVIAYLENEDVKELSKKTIEGILINISRPKQQGKIFVSINDKRCHEEFAQGVSVISEGRSYKYLGIANLFVSSNCYKDLISDGFISLRFGGIGQKVKLFDRSRLTEFGDKDWVEHLEFYIKNHDKLPDSFG